MKKPRKHLVRVVEYDYPCIPIRRIRLTGLRLKKGVEVAFTLRVLRRFACYNIGLVFEADDSERNNLKVEFRECLLPEDIPDNLLTSAKYIVADGDLALVHVLTESVKTVRIWLDESGKNGEILIEVRIGNSYFMASLPASGKKVGRVFEII